MKKLIITIMAVVMVGGIGAYLMGASHNGESNGGENVASEEVCEDATLYKCAKYGDDVYFSNGQTVCRMDLETWEPVSLSMPVDYVDDFTIKNGYVYFSTHGNGLGNTNILRRYSIEEKVCEEIIGDMGSYAFAIKGDKIYYSKYDESGDWSEVFYEAELDGSGSKVSNVSYMDLLRETHPSESYDGEDGYYSFPDSYYSEETNDPDYYITTETIPEGCWHVVTLHTPKETREVSRLQLI